MEDLPEDDLDMVADREWARSALRAYITAGGEGSFEHRPRRERLGTFYWLLAINAVLLGVLGVGLEVLRRHGHD